MNSKKAWFVQSSMILKQRTGDTTANFPVLGAAIDQPGQTISWIRKGAAHRSRPSEHASIRHQRLWGDGFRVQARRSRAPGVGSRGLWGKSVIVPDGLESCLEVHGVALLQQDVRRRMLTGIINRNLAKNGVVPRVRKQIDPKDPLNPAFRRPQRSLIFLH